MMEKMQKFMLQVIAGNGGSAIVRELQRQGYTNIVTSPI